MKSQDWNVVEIATIHTRILCAQTVLTFSIVLCLHSQTAARCLCRLVSCMAARRILNEISPILQHDIMPSTHCHNMIAIAAISRRLRRGSCEIRLHVARRFQAASAEVRPVVFSFFCCRFFHSRYFLYPLY